MKDLRLNLGCGAKRQREQLAESVRQRVSSVQPDLSLIRSRLLAQQQLYEAFSK